MGRPTRIAFLIATLGFLSSAFLSWNVLGGMPHIPDELSYLYQGRIFSSGHFSVPPPEVPEAFTVKWDHILRDSNGWRTIYPPGWPLLLCIGWWIHAPWIINPLLLFFTTLGLFKIAAVLYDEKVALYSLIAFVCSPFVLLMSAGFMAHPSTLCFSIWSVYFLIRGNHNDLVKAGAFAGYAFLIRPYTAVALLLPIFLWQWWKSQNRRNAAIQIICGALPLLILFFAYNGLQFGSFFRTGYSYDPDARFTGSILGYFKQNIPWYFHALNHGLWRFPWPDLIIFLPLLIPKQKWRTDALLAICFLSLMVAYSFYYYTDVVYSGPRYIFEAVGFLAILCARSLNRFDQKLTPYLLLIFLYPLVTVLPEQIEYHRQVYHGQSKELIDAVERQGVGKDALVLIGGDPHVFRTFYLENNLNPQKSLRVFAKDIPELREKIVRTYPRKEIWSMKIELEMVPGPNSYKDRAILRLVQWQRLK